MNPTERSIFGLLISVFFFWGFVAASNDILIPVLKEALDLKNWQSQLINFAFYMAYTIGSLAYMAHAVATKRDMISRMGYQKGIALGLTISALGTLLFIPAAAYNSYGFLISGLFVVGLGFSLQQTAANPFVLSLGSPGKASQRLSLAGGINNIGTTLGPLIIAYAIFGGLGESKEKLVSIDDVKIPYLLLGTAFLSAALLFYISGRKNQQGKTVYIKPNEHSDLIDQADGIKFKLSTYPQLYLGMVAIFFYVGVEVATGGNLGELLKKTEGFSDKNMAPYIALYWGSLMIGRWASAASVFTSNKQNKLILKFLLPYLAFGVFILSLYISGNPYEVFLKYVFVVPLITLADLLSKDDPAKQLFLFSILGIVSLLIGIFASGTIGIFAFVSVGLFCSTLWPCIFTLATKNLGENTTKGSSLLIMMIMGGAVMSLTQGALADIPAIGIRYSFFVGVACFIYLAYYAMRMKKQFKAL